jgi:hypothetical protein
MRYGGRQGDKSSRRWHGVALGCAVTVLVVPLTGVKLPHVVVVGIIGAAVLVIFVALGWWDKLAWVLRRELSRKLQGLREDGDSFAVGRVCTAAAESLDELLAPREDDLWSRATRLRERRSARRLLATYRSTYQGAIQDAIKRAGMIVSVPPEIVRAAGQPRTIADLQLLRDWLRRIASQCTAV